MFLNPAYLMTLSLDMHWHFGLISVALSCACRASGLHPCCPVGELPVGKRVEYWIPLEINCHLDAQLGTVRPSLMSCEFLHPAFSHVAPCCCPVLPRLENRAIEYLCPLRDRPKHSVKAPVGLPAMPSFRANWVVQSVGKSNSDFDPQMPIFSLHPKHIKTVPPTFPV